jgi:hypothetical protein
MTVSTNNASAQRAPRDKRRGAAVRIISLHEINNCVPGAALANVQEGEEQSLQ